MTDEMATLPRLKVDHLVKHFPIVQGTMIKKQVGVNYAVDDISFEVPRGASLGIIGETGCGKTTLARTIGQLDKATSGKVYFDGIDIVSLKEEGMRSIRPKIQLIFQESFGSYNPSMTMEKVFAELMVLHDVSQKSESNNQIAELFELVGLSKELRFCRPNDFSAGQRQCLGIARVIALDPSLVILDGAFSQLDPSLQSNLINVLSDSRKKSGASYLVFDTNQHNLYNLSDDVAIMYLGKFVEYANKSEVFFNPIHPYTQALLSSIAIADPVIQKKKKSIKLENEMHSSRNPPSGCRFRSRCPIVETICAEEEPELSEVSHGHFVACHVNAKRFVTH